MRQFHTHRSIAARTLKSLGYMRPIDVLTGALPINVGWRIKLQADDSFRKGATFAR